MASQRIPAIVDATAVATQPANPVIPFDKERGGWFAPGQGISPSVAQTPRAPSPTQRGGVLPPPRSRKGEGVDLVRYVQETKDRVLGNPGAIQKKRNNIQDLQTAKNATQGDWEALDRYIAETGKANQAGREFWMNGGEGGKLANSFDRPDEQVAAIPARGGVLGRGAATTARSGFRFTRDYGSEPWMEVDTGMKVGSKEAQAHADALARHRSGDVTGYSSPASILRAANRASGFGVSRPIGRRKDAMERHAAEIAQYEKDRRYNAQRTQYLKEAADEARRENHAHQRGVLQDRIALNNTAVPKDEEKAKQDFFRLWLNPEFRAQFSGMSIWDVQKAYRQYYGIPEPVAQNRGA